MNLCTTQNALYILAQLYLRNCKHASREYVKHRFIETSGMPVHFFGYV